MKNKKLIILIVVIIIALICVGIYFGIRAVKINKYTKADEYVVGSAKIASVNKVLGEKKIKKYSHTKTNIETLELTFEDPNKEQSVKEYMDYIKDSGNYIEMNKDNSNIRQLADPSEELVTVQTELTSDGFILTIEVGPGSIKINNIE